MVPTASLAAVLVYTGYKLVNPDNIRRLMSYGRMTVTTYAVTVIMIVATDLLTGIVCGLALSFASVVYALSHISVKVKHDRVRRRVDVYLHGAATFIRMPKARGHARQASARSRRTRPHSGPRLYRSRVHGGHLELGKAAQ
jgi:MFS superfamily sulfate permease-like transporter